MSVFKIDRDADGIVTLLIDMPGAVNVMNGAFTDALIETFEDLAKDTTLTGVVLASGKDTFFAGGDVKAMAAAPGSGYNEQITAGIALGRRAIRGIEKLKVPVVAAVNGAALGGGFELTLACNHCIAWDDKSVLIGLPEATLGLLPGGGGIVRMVKKFGLKKALPYLLDGTVVSAAQAREAGLVGDTVATREELVPRAKAWILAHKGDPNAAIQPWDRPDFRIPGGDLSEPSVRALINFMSFRLFEQTRGLLPNRPLILDIAVESLKLDLDTALKIESRGLATLILSPITKNMMSANFFQKNAIKRGLSRPSGVERTRIKTLGVVGHDAAAQAFAAAARTAGVAVLQGGADGPDLSGCDLVIGTATEVKPGAIPATQGIRAILNAPGSLADWAAFGAAPGKVIGLQVQPGADASEAVEIVRGAQTSDDTLAKTFDFVRQIGKTPIVVADRAGRFLGRIVASQLWEATQLVAEGVHPVRVDNLGKAIGLRVGPLTWADERGLWSMLQASTAPAGTPATARPSDPQPGVRAVVEGLVAGGRDAGGGFFDHTGGQTQLWPEIVRRYHRHDLSISDADIKDRLLFAAVIESLHCLQEGAVGTVAEANVGALLGAGAPTWTGGYLQFINTYGLQRFIDRCRALADTHGARFSAPSSVAEKVAAGATFT
jgi:3-hydroxyacyl-CoA dehydrogenase/enoyl-CoA hydratase/3-hydroxybutyryl-CoA epimerase